MTTDEIIVNQNPNSDSSDNESEEAKKLHWKTRTFLEKNATDKRIMNNLLVVEKILKKILETKFKLAI